MSLESYAHRAAKEIFAGWLRDLAEAACASDDRNPCVKIGDLFWRVNRYSAPFGVWVEYPIGHQVGANERSRDGLDPVWDEDLEDQNPVLLDHENCPIGSTWVSVPPSFEQLIDLGRPPQFIADIAIQHKGSIIHAVEIVHKHPPSAEKIAAFRACFFKTLVIPAHWVLGQVARPNYIPSEFFV